MGSRKWAVDFIDNSYTLSIHDIPDPPGFTHAFHDLEDSTLIRQQEDAIANCKFIQAWEMPQGPAKHLLMNALIMLMIGNNVHIFSILVIYSAILLPLCALPAAGRVFEPYKGNKVDIRAPKLVFIALLLGDLFYGVWKLYTMGLLPTRASYWVSSLPPPHEIEGVFG